MAIIVNTNLSALMTQNNLNKASNSLNTALERMSTGYKINSAKDGAANMFVATNLEKQINGSKIAQSNVSMGINVLDTVEGDLDVILDNLNRIRDLTVQASNGIYDDDSKEALANEVSARMDEITRVVEASNFNGLQLLNGSIANDLRLQVGADSDAAANSISISKDIFASKNAQELGLDPTNITTAFATPTAAANYLEVVDEAIKNVNTSKATIGSVQNRLQAASDSLTTTIENATAAKSTIMDADIAEVSAEFTRQQILLQTSSALLLQANSLPSMALTLVSGI